MTYKNCTHTFKELKDTFGIDSHRYYRWKELLKTTGSLEDEKVCERKRKIDREALRKPIEEKPDSYLCELAEPFGYSIQAVFHPLGKMKNTYKKRRSLILENPKKRELNLLSQ